MSQTGCDFVVLVALDEEAEYFRQVVKCGDVQSLGAKSYWVIEDASWKPFGKGIIVSSGDMGHDLARETLLEAHRSFGFSTAANIGIAGRVDDDLRLGDVIVPQTIFDVTSGGKVSGSKNKIIFSHAPVPRPVPGDLAKLAGTHLKQGSRHLRLDNERLARRFPVPGLLPSSGIRVISKPVACVPQVGAHDAYKKSLRDLHRGIAAMEMESAGFLKAGEELGIAVVCVRGLSDGADFGKRQLEEKFQDENRRFALESAVIVLESIFLLDLERTGSYQEPGISIYYPGDIPEETWADDLQKHESLFSLLVHNSRGDDVEKPIHELVLAMRDPSQSPVALLGEKGVGKTTLFRYLQRAVLLDCDQPNELVAVLVRISEMEFFTEGQIDRQRTLQRFARVREIVALEADKCTGTMYLLIDGLNRTGAVRVELVAELLRRVALYPNIRIALTAENEQDLRSLYQSCPTNIRNTFVITPLDIEDERAGELVNRFASILGAQENAILADMRAKDVRSLDVFILAQFFRRFSEVPYRNLGTMGECYELLCQGELSEQKWRTEAERREVMANVASTAFDILISRKKSLSDVQDEDVARLISNHSSVTNYLVAAHVMDTIRTGLAGATKKLLNDRLSYIFPAEVNSYQKQMMKADPNLESTVARFIQKRSLGLHSLARSHVAYLAGRVANHKSEMLAALSKIGVPFDEPGAERQGRMLRRAVFISRSFLGEREAELEYVDILLNDVDEAEFNRGFHLEYYGDVAFEPSGRMLSRDEGQLPCNRTFARLLDRIQRLPTIPLIELLTLLSLVQVRHQSGCLRRRHRRETLELLAGDKFRSLAGLPPKVAGYIGRLKEDLASDEFDLSTILQEWGALSEIPRTGWLKRRAEAVGDGQQHWRERKIESVAEHELSTLGLAAIFLFSKPQGEEKYDKLRICEMLLVHDLAEARLGDQLPEETDPIAEQEELWKYGAFATYRGVGDIWWIPKLFKEFCDGQTMDAKIARDLDRLQFMLQARLHSPGLSEEERWKCEQTADRISSTTVRDICERLKGFPAKPRFEPPIPSFDAAGQDDGRK